MRKVLLILVALAVPIASPAQAGARPEVLVLGTFHMANPGHDIHNMEADDVLSPARQRELAEVIDVLKRFRPTKIAVEASVGSERLARDYTAYLAGKYTLTRNEIDQIGFRLAKELGHTAVHAVDVDGEFQWMRVSNYAKANGGTQHFDAIQAQVAARVKSQGDFLRSHTALEMLELMNADTTVARALTTDFEYVSFGDPQEFAGPDMLTFWYQRNIRIYNRIAALAQSPGDRILVVYGAGHVGPLRQLAANDARVTLRKLADLTERQGVSPRR